MRGDVTDRTRRKRGRTRNRRVRWMTMAIDALATISPGAIVACPWAIRPSGCDPDCVCGHTGRATASQLIGRYRALIADAEDRRRA